MKLDCNAYGTELLEYPTVLAGLSDNRILKIERKEDGSFRVAEGCSDYFSALLTPQQLAAFGRELIEMAAAKDDAAPTQSAAVCPARSGGGVMTPAMLLFLSDLAALLDRHGAVLVFDTVDDCIRADISNESISLGYLDAGKPGESIRKVLYGYATQES